MNLNFILMNRFTYNVFTTFLIHSLPEAHHCVSKAFDQLSLEHRVGFGDRRNHDAKLPACYEPLVAVV